MLIRDYLIPWTKPLYSLLIIISLCSSNAFACRTSILFTILIIKEKYIFIYVNWSFLVIKWTKYSINATIVQLEIFLRNQLFYLDALESLLWTDLKHTRTKKEMFVRKIPYIWNSGIFIFKWFSLEISEYFKD